MMEDKKKKNIFNSPVDVDVGQNVENYCTTEARSRKTPAQPFCSSSSSSSLSAVKGRKGKKKDNNNNNNNTKSSTSSSSSSLNSSSFRPTSSHVELLTDLISLFVPEYGDFLHCTNCLTSFSDFSHLAHHFKKCGSKSESKSESESSLTERTIKVKTRKRKDRVSPASELGQLSHPHSDNSLDFNLDPSKFIIPESCVSFFPIETEESENIVNIKVEPCENNNNDEDFDNITIKTESPTVKIETEWESECENVEDFNGNFDSESDFSCKNLQESISSLPHFLQPSPHLQRQSVIYKISKEVQERIKISSMDESQMEIDKATQREKAKRSRMTKLKPKSTKEKAKVIIEKPTPKKEQVKTKTKSTSIKTAKQKLQCKSPGFLSSHETSQNKLIDNCQYDGPGFKCDQPNCGRILSNRHSLTSHKKRHSPDEDRKCPICGIIFSTPFYVKNHVKFTHQNLKEFVCDFCGKSFAKGPQLTDHLRTHSKERPYLCPLCGQTFALRTGLRRHQIVHTKIKRFKCDFCDKRFTGNQMRRFHMARKTCLKNKEKSNQTQNQENEKENNVQVNQNNDDSNNEK